MASPICIEVLSDQQSKLVEEMAEEITEMTSLTQPKNNPSTKDVESVINTMSYSTVEANQQSLIQRDIVGLNNGIQPVKHDSYSNYNHITLEDRATMQDPKNGIETAEQDNYHSYNNGALEDAATIQPIAPPLNETTSHHIVFIAHPKDQNWVTDVINRLETPALGFKCWYQDREYNPNLNGSQMRTNTNGITKSLKTVIVISKDFLNDVWLNPSTQPFSGQELSHLRMDIILMLLDDCDIPPPLLNFICIDIGQSNWWTRLIGQLCSFDEVKLPSEGKRLSTYSSSTISAANGYLILSIKSRCIYCGQEMIDTSDVPHEFIMNGIQISQEEYRCALHHLMKDSKFRCHVWCYNVPAAIVFFSLFLGICLTAIPLLESKYVLKGKENGLEFVHGGVVWLCVLTGYMLVMHISKKKMKLSTYHRLRYVNAILSKHNLLAGVENLGMADCNKYYLHFFYFDVGPCLLYLQELFAALDEPPSTIHTADTPDHLAIDLDCDTHNNSDSNGLGTNLTNATMQNKAEELILQNSGEYLSHLITKKLDRPHRQRHIKNYPCLCQYVEEKAYKLAS